jgi:hypothetical protein
MALETEEQPLEINSKLAPHDVKRIDGRFSEDSTSLDGLIIIRGAITGQRVIEKQVGDRSFVQ